MAKDYYFCYHNQNGIEEVYQTYVNVKEENGWLINYEQPTCPKCGKIMTYGRWTDNFERGSVILTSFKVIHGKLTI